MLHRSVVPFEDAKTVIVFDTHNTIYRMAGQKELSRLRTRDGRPSGFVYGFDKSVKMTLSDFSGPSTALVFGWDSAGSKDVRRTFYPEYKMNRADRPDIFLEMFGMGKAEVFGRIEEYIEQIPHNDLRAEKSEFDDLIAAMVRAYPKKQFTIISTDKDLWQLLTFNNVNIVGSFGKAVGVEQLDKAFGLTEFNQVYLYKVLFGDPSDNICSMLPRVIKKGIVEDVIKPLSVGERPSPETITSVLAKCSTKRAVEIANSTGFVDALTKNMMVVDFISVDVPDNLSGFLPGSVRGYNDLLDEYEISR